MSEEKPNLTDLEQRLFEFTERIKQIRASLSRADRSPPNLVECIACRDVFPLQLRELTEGYCVDCYKEIAFGVIPKGTVRLGGGSPHYTVDEADSPWGENAKRAMEGD